MLEELATDLTEER